MTRADDARTIETRAVLAGAYRGRAATGAMLRHAVRVDADGHAVAVLCTRVALDNLADRHAGDPLAAPTCAVCLQAARALLDVDALAGYLRAVALECQRAGLSFREAVVQLERVWNNNNDDNAGEGR
jgi:hypothetical protein